MKTLSAIPSPPISRLSIGSVSIHIYALCILTGIVLAVWIVTRRWRRMGGNFDQILDTVLCAVPSGIVGARLYHVAVTAPREYFGPGRDWTAVLRIWEGGLGIFGGVLFGALAAWAWCRHRHYPLALLADAVAPGLLVAQAVGRLGNWFNRELYGGPTTLPWGLAVDDSGVLYHPTFLYELLWNLIGAGLIVWAGRALARRLASGSLFAMYMVWYTVGRTWVDAMRTDPSSLFLGVRIHIWVALGVLAVGIVVFILLQRSGMPRQDLEVRLSDVTALEAGSRSSRRRRSDASVTDSADAAGVGDNADAATSADPPMDVESPDAVARQAGGAMR